MRPTEILKEEHKAIKLMLSILEKLCAKLESGEKINAEHLLQIVDFIRVFADKCHHGKEEDKLFPALEEAGIPGEGGPIGVMLIEHDEGRNYVRELSDSVNKYKKGDTKVTKNIIENARNYIDLLTQHIYKEDNILYPMGERVLSKEKESELLREFEKIEEERIGHGKHEQFHLMLERLEKVYLTSSE